MASFKSSPHPFFVGTLTTVLALNFLPIIGRAISSSIGRSFPAAMSPRSRGPSFKTPLKSLFPWMSFYGTRFWSLHPSLLKTGNWVGSPGAFNCSLLRPLKQTVPYNGLWKQAEHAKSFGYSLFNKRWLASNDNFWMILSILLPLWGLQLIQLIIKHKYLRSPASRCLSLSSSSYLSVKSLRFFRILTFIEILMLISWIPASKNL